MRSLEAELRSVSVPTVPGALARYAFEPQRLSTENSRQQHGGMCLEHALALAWKAALQRSLTYS